MKSITKKLWWAHGRDKIDECYRQIFCAVKGYPEECEVTFRKGFILSRGGKLVDPEQEYNLWRKKVDVVIQPYKELNYSDDDIRFMRNLIKEAEDYWFKHEFYIKDWPVFNTYGFRNIYYYSCLPTLFGDEHEFLNPFWLYLDFKCPNGFGYYSDNNFLFVKGIRLIKERYSMFDYEAREII